MTFHTCVSSQFAVPFVYVKFQTYMKLLHNHFFPIRLSPIIHIYSLLSKVVNGLLTLHLGKVKTSTIPGNKSQVINTISEIQTRLPEDTKWSIRKSSTGSNNRRDFILSQIMDILEIVNKGLGRMKRTLICTRFNISTKVCLVNKKYF